MLPEAMTTDVLVCGSGPAGSATAISLRDRGLDTILIERSDATSVSSGEHLSPRGVVALDRLGLGMLLASPQHARCPYIESAWGGSGLAIHDYIGTAYGSGFNLDRKRFDSSLRERAVNAGARLLTESYVKSVSRHGFCWRVELAGATEGTVVNARFLVDATGRSAWVARRLGARIERVDRLVAATATLQPEEAGSLDNSRLLIEATEFGWWYSVHLSSGRTVASWMSDADMLRTDGLRPTSAWRKALLLAPYTAARCAGRSLEGPVKVAVASSQRLCNATGNGWLATGDAAQAYDPLSSEGISKGLLHGAAAAHAVSSHLNGNREALQGYAALLAHDFATFVENRLFYYGTESRWATSPFWRSRRQLHGHRAQ